MDLLLIFLIAVCFFSVYQLVRYFKYVDETLKESQEHLTKIQREEWNHLKWLRQQGPEGRKLAALKGKFRLEK